VATIFPVDAQIDDIFEGYRYNGIAWKIIGISLTEEYLTKQEADSLYQAIVSIYDGGNSPTYTPTLIIDGGQSQVDFVDLIDAGFSVV
jgi:hypothetical protein